MNCAMNLMLLAAGEGTRLRPLTLEKPKPAIGFLEIPMAYYSLALMGNTPIHRLVVNTYYLPDQITKLMKQIENEKYFSELCFSHEAGQIMGSGGGLGQARDFFTDQKDLVMMNGDEVVIPQNQDIIRDAITLHRQNKNLATLLVMEDSRVGSQFGGVWVDENNQVLGFGKTKPDKTQKGWHYIGVQIISTEIFASIPRQKESNILYDVLTQHLDRVQVFPIQCTWFETGNPHDLQVASQQCRDFLHSEPNNYQKKYLEQVQLRFVNFKTKSPY